MNTATRHQIGTVLGLSKASLQARLERQRRYLLERHASDEQRQTAEAMTELLDRRGTWYTLDELEFLSHVLYGLHDEVVLAHAHKALPVEVWRARENKAKFNRAQRIIEELSRVDS